MSKKYDAQYARIKYQGFICYISLLEGATLCHI